MRSVDAMTGEEFAVWPFHTADEIDRCFVDAREAFLEWRTRSVASRAASIAGLAALLRDDVEALAHLMTREMGKPIGQARGEISKCAGLVEHFASHGASYLTPRSVELDEGGACVVLSRWVLCWR